MLTPERPEFVVEQFQHFVHEHPRDWASAARLADARLTAGDQAVIDGRLADAVSCLTVVANWRIARGDRPGAAELRARIERLELEDLEALVRRMAVRR